MKKVLLAVVLGFGLVGFGLTGAVAQELVPCCEGGFQPNKRCNTDENCKGVCVGGARDAKACRDDSKCPAACTGGANDGERCSSDGDCPGGSCGAPGVCEQGTCTALCQKGKPPKSPSDPAALVIDELLVGPVLLACP